ncbi:MAG TPA: hypothetical protein VE007_08210 [Thermoanaerobaculia bacterium]|nr:hypothetical protein [Thermoanaerobaculia bacterium]
MTLRGKCLRAAMAAFAIALTTSCNKTFTGSWDLGDLSDFRTIVFTGNFDNAEGAATIGKASVSFDNVTIFTGSFSGESHVAFSGSFPGDRGHHTLIVKVDEQTNAQNDYRVSALTVILKDRRSSGGLEIARVFLPDRVAKLASGGGITYEFDL